MNTSPSIGALAAALAKAQAAFPPIPKNKEARVPLKAGGSYTYHYADLADLLDATRPALAANGLALIQPVAVNGLQVTITTRLIHSSGEWIEESLTMKAVDDRPQSQGAASTYGRRYSAAGMLNVAPDEDVDGEVQEVAPRQRQAKAPPAQAPAAPPPAEHKKADPAVLAKVENLLKTSNLTRAGFGAAASRVLGHPVHSAAELTLADVAKVEAAVRAAQNEVPDEELGRRQVPVQDYQDGSGVAA